MYTTHPSFALDVVQLALGAFADALRAPQLDAHPSVRKAHGSNGQEVRQEHVHHVVAAIYI